jgi:hypothetical protein
MVSSKTINNARDGALVYAEAPCYLASIIADLVEMRIPVNGDGSPFFNHPADFHAEMLANFDTAWFAGQQAGGIKCR